MLNLEVRFQYDVECIQYSSGTHFRWEHIQVIVELIERQSLNPGRSLARSKRTKIASAATAAQVTNSIHERRVEIVRSIPLTDEVLSRKIMSF